MERQRRRRDIQALGDLPRRLATGAALNAPDRATFYGGGDRGYTDYPALDAVPTSA